jgi:hypothetical protein
MKSEATNSDHHNAVIFSLADGIVWASWPGKTGRVEMGHQAAVTYMMRNFLAQCELGERMTASGANKKRATVCFRPKAEVSKTRPVVR